MEYLSQTMNSSELCGVIALPPSLRNRRVQIIVLPNEEINSEEPNCKCNIGIAKGADIPDSFFEPLPEEDLQAWGL